MLEAILHAIMYGIAAGTAALLALTVLSRLVSRELCFAQCLTLFSAAFIVTCAVCYAFWLHPTHKRAAARIDRVGLEERVSTMVAFRDDTSFICQAQRADAAEKLSRVKPKQVAFSFPRRSFFLCLLMAALVVGLSFIPYDILSASSERTESTVVESEEARLIREMIADLRAKIEAADISEAEKNRLLAQLDQLEAGIGGGSATLSALAEISRAAEEIEKSVEAMELSMGWAVELMKFECLRALGEAILERNHDKVRLAFADIEHRLVSVTSVDQVAVLNEITRAIDTALETKAPDDNEAALAFAFSSLSGDLKAAAEDAYHDRDATDRIRSGIRQAEERILMYLSDQVSEANLEKADHEEEKHENEMVPADAEGDSAEGAPAPDSEGGKMEEGEGGRLMHGADRSGQVDTGRGVMDQQYHTVTELVYEPTLDPTARRASYVSGASDNNGGALRERATGSPNEGSVPYGQVYGVYFAKLLDQFTAGEIPDSFKDIVEAYFYGL